MIYKIPTLKEGGNWIQKAVNPKHRGFCTPMTKATCTPRRKALARTFKKMAKDEQGGVVAPVATTKKLVVKNTVPNKDALGQPTGNSHTETKTLIQKVNPVKKTMGGQIASKIEKKPAGSYNTVQSYKDGTDNKRNAPKYANAAKCGKKLVKKKMDGGNVSPHKSTEPMVHSKLVKHLEEVATKTVSKLKKHKKGGTINIDNILAL